MTEVSRKHRKEEVYKAMMHINSFSAKKEERHLTRNK